MGQIELVRWSLYLDLGFLFGAPAAALLLRMPDVLEERSQLMAIMAAAAILFTLAGFWVLVADMAGTGLADVDAGLILDLAASTAVGWACIARLLALAAALLVFAVPADDKRWTVLPTGTALATLAWSGHAASGAGAPGTVRLAVDIVHLAAASVWLGALVLFTLLLVGGRHRSVLPAALIRFAGLGTLLVFVLVSTGLANLVFVWPSFHWANVAATAYGRLLAIKLGLFGAMLTLAAINHFLLVPRLAGETSKGARSKLRLTISAELGCALGVLIVVAFLGLLDPAAV